MSELTRRPEGRTPSQLRPVEVKLNVQRNAAGSVLISTGHTRVICAASIEKRVPHWLRDQDPPRGWVTGEYAMLPGSGSTRINRRQNSRATEIQRLIGRSLRAAVDLHRMPGVMITLDCDVLDADGGTRTAAITGAWMALHMAIQTLLKQRRVKQNPIIAQIAATSVGIVDGQAVLDLDYIEDQDAEVDMNVVGTDGSALVEVQGTAERGAFSRGQMNEMLDLAQHGIAQLFEIQNRALGIGTDRSL